MDPILINGVPIAASPATLSPGIDDIDAETTGRMSDGTLTRDRLAVKRQIDMSWGLLTWPEISALLKQMSAASFTLTYPDPQDGKYSTRTFYAGKRTPAVALAKAGTILWSGLRVTLTEY
ncbi:DUF6711 family protein [Paenibacillus sp. NFR01]|uniref:DUF6711 family protein n=1 Tax=Paenibacillus sp. NFR01 TaxID=1566279 RepID=UPI0008B13B41|nr:DUF6711 family protein [Paenibacillus sp. NFR01]SEU32781.1 hypothetical protein SAMN03159358_0154 [Paenibacillus sp. NFR01]